MALTAGDIAFVGLQADNTGGGFNGDAFQFVLLVDVTTGETVFFTDNGYRTDTSTFRTNENMVRWVAQSNLTAGTIITFTAPGGTGQASTAEWTGINPVDGATNPTAPLGLAGGGDNIIAIVNPTFGGAELLTGTAIAAITLGSATFAATWTNTSGNASTALPPGLTDGVNAVSLGPNDNGRYNPDASGSVESGTASDVRNSINNDANWEVSNTPLGATTATFTIGGDITPPTVSTLSPADDATGAAVGANLVVTFSENIQKGTGNIVIKRTSDNSVVETIDVTTAQATVSGQNLTIDPTSNLDFTTGYYVEIAAGAIEDLASNDFAGITGATTWNFTTAAAGAPDGSGTAIVRNSTAGALNNTDIFRRNTTADATVTLTGVSAGALGKISITLPTGWAGLLAGNVTLGGTGLSGASFTVTGSTIDITGATLTDVATGTVTITGLTTPNPTALTDDGDSTFTVQTATSSGTLTNIASQPLTYITIPITNLRDVDANGVPLDNTNIVAIEGVATPSVSFGGTANLNSFLQDTTAGVGVFRNSASAADDLIQGNNFVVKGTVGQFNGNTQINLFADTDIYNLGAGTLPTPLVTTVAALLANPEQFEGSLIRIVSLSKTSGTWPTTGSSASITVSDGTGTLTLRIDSDTNIDGSPEPTYPAEITGIFTQFDNSSPFNSGYQIQPRNTADIVGTADTTPPTISTLTPGDDAVGVVVGANLVATFSEAVQKGTGNIVIRRSSDNSVVETIDVTSAQVTVSGNQVTINPTNDLTTSTGFYVEIATGAIEDLASNDFAGIANATTWNFTTAATTGGVPLPVINNFDTNLGTGWTAFSVDSDAANTWFFTSNSGGRAEANGFGDSAAANDWLISPGVNLDSTTGEVVSFTAFTQFTDSGTPNPLQFLYSTNYIGTGNPNSATWTPLSFTAPAANSQTDTNSGNISLNSITGSNVYFAFQYQSSGTGGSNSTLWRVDNFNLRVPTPNITLTQSGSGTAVTEGTGTDTYTIALDTVPTAPVNISITAPSDLQISLDGLNFFGILNLNFTTTTPVTVSVRAINDGISEGIENVAITHTVSSSDANYNNFAIPNVNVTVGDAGIIRIYDIQGASHISPALGLNLTSQGVVTALESNGFYMQDPTGDGNIATSDGIFVFTSSAPTVTVGQSVQVVGTVSEFSGGVNLSITQISSSNANVSVIASLGTVTPTIIGGTPSAGVRVPPNQFIEDDNFTSFDPATDGADFFESLEGMLVTVRDTVVVAPRFGTGGSAEIYVLPDFGAGATGFSTRGTSNIGPQDFNPERIQLDADVNVLPSFNFPDVNVGDRLGNVTGVVTYSSGNYEINPTQVFTLTPDPTPLTPEVTTLPSLASRAPNQLSIASYNVLNLDPNDGTGPTEAEPDNDIANGRFAKIAQHIVTNLGRPDIIGLQEIQDNDGTANTSTTSASVTLQTLIDAIDLADDGVDNNSLNYAFIDNTFIVDDQSGGAPGGNIRTAFLYNPNRVTFVPGSAGTISTTGAFSTTPANFFDSRPPIVAKFTFNGNEITVVNNHLSSKGGSANTFGATAQDFGSRQEDPTVNGSLDERRQQAQAVNNYLDSVLASNPNANIIVTGDMNEFEFVSPLKILAGSEVSSSDGLTVTPSVNPAILLNLTDTLPLNERYSFIFQGNSQSLDHILVSNNLAPFAQMDIVHTNIEFAEATNTASDHDPLVALVNFPIKVAASVGDGTITGTSGNDLINLGNGDNTVNALGGNDVVNGGAGDNTINGGAGNDFLDGAGGNDDIDGGSGNDIIFGGSGDDTLLGNTGDDLISGGSGNDLIDGGTGNDLAVFDGSGNASNFSISVTGTGTVNATAAGLGIDTLLNIEGVQLIGGSGNNTLTGWSGNDFLTGGAGNDTLIGGLGIDTVVETYASGNNTILLTNTSLKINGISDASLNGIEQAQLTAGTDNDILDATAFSLGTVTLNAGGGNDTLWGGTKNDILDGGNGNDTLIGGLGTDKLTGGVGSDRFTFDTNTAFSATTIGNDTITDFNFSEDFIVLDRTTFSAFTTTAATATGKAIDPNEFSVITTGGATAAGTQSSLIVYESSTGNLFYNQNKATAGLGTGGQFATLQTGLTETQLESRILVAL